MRLGHKWTSARATIFRIKIVQSVRQLGEPNTARRILRTAFILQLRVRWSCPSPATVLQDSELMVSYANATVLTHSERAKDANCLASPYALSKTEPSFQGRCFHCCQSPRASSNPRQNHPKPCCRGRCLHVPLS